MLLRAAGWLITCLLLPPLPVAAQNTRAAQLERERADKAKRLKPYEPRKLETWVMRAEEGRLRRMIAPHNGFFAEYGYTHRPVGAGIGFGGGWRHDLFDRQARVVLEAGATFRRYHMFRADFSLPRLADERIEVGVEGVYRNQPQDDFYGLGPNTQEAMRVSYLFEGREFQGRAIVKPRTWFHFGTRVGVLSPSIDTGKDTRFPSIEATFDDSLAPALLAQPDYRYGEAFAEVDYRDEPGNARSGGYYAVAWRAYNDSDLDRYSFRLLDAQARQFFPIFDKKRVFALKTELVSTTPQSGHRVPFFMQPTLGGGHTLRGVNDYRFRDRAMFNFNVEYRWEAFAALDMALFTDFGTVAPRVSDLDFGDLKRSYGIGLRFNTPSAVFFRIDVATGAGEGLHYFFKFSNAF
jgi:surface antigen Omp85-like protein